MRKRQLSLILVVWMLCALTGCSAKNNNNPTGTGTQPAKNQTGSTVTQTTAYSETDSMTLPSDGQGMGESDGIMDDFME